MTTITFDTLAYSKILQDAGMPAEQANAFANAQKIAMSEVVPFHEIATKSDLLSVKNELYNKIAETKYEILKWVITAMLAQTAIIVSIMAFLK